MPARVARPRVIMLIRCCCCRRLITYYALNAQRLNINDKWQKRCFLAAVIYENFHSFHFTQLDRMREDNKCTSWLCTGLRKLLSSNRDQFRLILFSDRLFSYIYHSLYIPKLFFLLLIHEGSHSGRSTRNSNPVMTSSAGPVPRVVQTTGSVHPQPTLPANC